MSTVTFNPITDNGLSFTNIVTTETDAGNYSSFNSNPGALLGVSTTTGANLQWGAVTAGAYYAGSSEVVNFNYTVSSTSSTSLIDTVGQLYTTDLLSGPGVSLTAVENIYSTTGTLLGTETFTGGTTNVSGITLSQAEQTVNVSISLTMSVSATTGTANSGVSISAIQQSFGTIAAPPATASIGDIVFFDASNTGLETGFDAGPGVAGVTVELLNGTGTSVLATTTTDSSGAYNFGSLTAGVYEVKFVAPTGYGFSTQGAGGSADASINSSANQTTGITAPITLTAGQADHNVEAGLVPGGSGASSSATIGNTVWLDSNGDGLDDNSETGVAGVTVELLNGTGTTVLATTTTNASGGYQFTSLAAGTYEVQVVAPTGDTFTTENVSAGTTGDMNSVFNSSGLTSVITLTSGQIDSMVNAGLIAPTPAVSIAKTVTSVNGVAGDPNATAAGQVIDYSIVVTNTGNEALTNVVVQDTTLGTTLGTIASLAVGASATYTAAQTVTQAEINSGAAVTNTATVTDTQNATASTTASTAVTQKPSVSIVKSVTSVNGVAGDPNATAAGQVIDYGIVVTNTGNETLTNVVVQDTTLGTTLGTIASLAPGATASYTAAQTVTQAEINSGAAVTDTATVSDTQTATQSSTASTAVTQKPSVSIVKSVTSVNGVSGDPAATAAGQVIGYSVVVTNTGNETLTNVSVLDTTLGTTLGTIASLAPGASDTYTTSQTVTQAEINAGTAIANTATVSDTQTATQSSTASTAVTQAPAVSIVKSVTSVNGVAGDPAATAAGQVIDYGIVVTNTGNETLTNVVVQDTTLGTTLGTIASLAPGATATYTAAQTVTAAEIAAGAPVTNTATVSDSQTPTGSSTASTSISTGAGITVLKEPCSLVVNSCGQVTYTFLVTNTGSRSLTNVTIKDNIGTAANPDYVTPTLVTTGTNGILGAGQTWTYTETVNQINCTTGSSGSVCHTATGSNLGSGNTAWLSSSFNPTSCANGATYKFQGITCTISGSGVGSKPITVNCPDSLVTFSSSCKSATTVYNSSTNCWVTTLPANCNPGSVFLSGCPQSIASGCNLTNATCSWSIADSSNNCGASSLNWDASCTGYQSFNQNGCNGLTDYNQIGVKSCDNQSGYGLGGSCGVGYGYTENGYCDTGYNGYGGGCGGSYNYCGWNGSSSDNCGTPENLFTNNNCGNTNTCNDYNNYGGWGGCGGGSNNSGSCGDSGSDTQNCTNIAGAADTVTVSATTTTSSGHCTTTASGGNLSSGCTAWLSSTFKPTSCANGATYNFTGVVCKISGSGLSSAITVNCPNSTITFSTACTTATTVYNATTNCWVTTLPANCNPGNVFLSGCPSTVPSGCNLSGATVSWSVNSATNNCGSTSLNWAASCTGYNNFDSNNCNGLSNFNQIGVKACDTLSGYGSGGNCGWGNAGDVAATPINQISYGNCGQSSSCTTVVTPTATCSETSTTSTGITVTATDTKEVQVLGCNSNISVGGTATTASLSGTYGTAQTLEFTYNPGNTVSLKQVQAGLGTVTGTNSNTMAFMEISNNANPFASGASIYFQGEVTSGEEIYADATTNVLTNTPIAGGHFSATAGADTYAYVFTSESAFLAGAAPVQTMAYNTSGSQAMHIGDTVGSLSLIGYVGATGGHLNA